MPIPPAILAAIPGAVATVGGIITNAWNAREASKNRRFQERMSSTSHQREVADLRAANINPALRSLSGASTPGGDRAQMEDVVSKGVSTALAVKAQRAQIELIQAQALLARNQAADIQTTMAAGRGREITARADAAEMTTAQLREALPLALAKARAEIEATMSSAEAAKARAVLDRAASSRAVNIAEFEKQIGQMGPAVRFLLEILRGLR